MKYILISCDTEVGEIGMESNIPEAFEYFIEGKINHQILGYKRINDIAEKYSARVDHFIDIYPYERYGESKYIDLCNNILQSGHFVHLHTHPSGKYDPSRRLMHQYALDEQKKIIEFGCKTIEKWTGKKPVAHRAGAYGADENTLKALADFDIIIDSSFNKGSSKSRIKYPYVNAIQTYNNIYQIPVTIFQKTTVYKPFDILSRKRNQKFDFRYGSNANELLKVIDLCPDSSVITIFLHSCNFLTIPYYYRKKRFGKIEPDNQLIEDYESLLSGIQSMSEVTFSNADTLYKQKIITSDFNINIKSKDYIFTPLRKELQIKLGLVYK